MNKRFTQVPEYSDYVYLKSTESLSGKKLYTVTLGCQQNEADSERIKGMLHSLGVTDTDTPENADIIIVNTCAVREHAELKALSILGKFKALKQENPELIIGVVGCMVAEESRREQIKRSFRQVDFTVEPGLLHTLPSLIRTTLERAGRRFATADGTWEVVEDIPVYRASEFKAWVSIMYGCNNFCTYCIVPYVRGRERSRESADVIAECKELINSGVKEITLLGQNVNSYRSDMDFADLISTIAELEGDFIIRFMTSHPKDVSPRLIEAIRRYSGKIAPHFHLPLQSGSDRILKSMNRTYTKEKYLSTVNALREAVPDIALTTDIIVGFPGESDADFEETMQILRAVKFDAVFSFIYSKRTGTVAAGMTDTVSRADADKRMATLLSEQTEISFEKNLPFVGKTLRVLVEGISKKDDGTYSARTPEGKLVHFCSDKDYTGQFILVKIERAGAFALIGSEII